MLYGLFIGCGILLHVILIEFRQPAIYRFSMIYIRFIEMLHENRAQLIFLPHFDTEIIISGREVSFNLDIQNCKNIQFNQ